MPLMGMPIIESPLLTDPEEREVRRSWRERLFTRQWRGGIHIISVTVGAEIAACIWTAQRLGHPIVAKMDGDNGLKIFGLPAQS